MQSKLAATIADLPLAQRIVAGSAAVVLLLAMIAFGQWISSPTYTVLYSDIDDAQLATVITQLDSDNIDYKLEGGGSRVLVPKADVYKVRASLAASGIQAGVTPQGYELLDEQGLSVSDFRQRVDYQRALEGELARTLTAIESIPYANVHLVIPEDALFAEDEEPVSASVLVDSIRELTQGEIETITFLVGSAVEGLEPSDVTVAHVSGQVLHAAGEASTTSGIGNSNLRMTREFEDTLAADVGRLLASVVGANRSSVVVRAEMNFDERSTESETYDKESSTQLREQLINEQFNGTGTPPAGAVGVDGEVVETETDGDYSYSRDESITEYGVDRLVTRTTSVPGRIEKLSVAVIVDDGSLTGTPVPEKSEIEALVSAAIGLEPTRGDTIEVSTVAFPAAEEIEEAAVEAEAAPGGSIFDLLPEIIGGVILLIVAIGLLLMSRSGKSDSVEVLPEDWSPRELPAETRAELAQALGAPLTADPMHDLEGNVLELVERQPEEIANLLRSWLADRRTS